MRASNVARLLQMDEDLKRKEKNTERPARAGADPYNATGRLASPARPRAPDVTSATAREDRNSQTGMLRSLRRALDLMRSNL